MDLYPLAVLVALLGESTICDNRHWHWTPVTSLERRELLGTVVVNSSDGHAFQKPYSQQKKKKKKKKTHCKMDAERGRGGGKAKTIYLKISFLFVCLFVCWGFFCFCFFCFFFFGGGEGGGGERCCCLLNLMEIWAMFQYLLTNRWIVY